MSKANKILALLLATQLALIAYMYRPTQVNGPPTVQFFENIAAGQVVGLTITDNTQSLAIEKKGKGWGLKTDSPYPADANKVDALVKKLLALTSSRLVARTDTSHVRLKVATNGYNRKLTLTLNNGETRTLLLGSSPNYKTVHVRSAEDDNVYLVNDLADGEVPVAPEDWWSNNYLNLEPETLTHLTLTNSLGRIELARDEKNNWQVVEIPTGKKLADEALPVFLDKACLIQLSSYLGRDLSDAATGLDKPLLDLELVTATGTISLKIAAGGEKDEYIAKATDSPFYVSVHGYEIKSLLEASLNELLIDKKEVAATKE